MNEFVHDQQRDLHRHRWSPSVPATEAPLWPGVAVMLALALVVYLPAALRAGLLDFDDPFFFGPTNPEFREGLGAVLDPSRPIANAWLPVAHASLWLEYRLFGAEHPFWPHLSALLLHAATAVVVLRLLLSLGVSRGLAHLAAAMFVVHPALAESVAWVSGRKDLLAGLFGFTALLLAVRFCRRPGLPVALTMMGCAALAMYSKATAVVLPFLALVFAVHTGGPRRRFLAPLLLLAVTVPIAWHHQTIAAGEGTLGAGDPAERLTQVPGALLHYVRTSLWPLHLNVLYPEVATLERFREQLVPGAVAAGLLGLVALFAWRRAISRPLAVGVCTFVVALLPFNTAYPASSIAAADRYLYFAMPGMALAAVVLLQLVLRRWALWGGAVVLLPLAWLGGGRAHEFESDQTLWRSSLAVEPANAVAHLNLVFDLLQGGPAELETVRTHLETAVATARYPVHELRARQQLVRIAVMQAQYPLAAAHARAAIAAARAQLAQETGAKRQAEARGLLLQALLAAFEPLVLADEAAAAAALHAEAKALLPDHPDVIAFGEMRDLLAVVAATPADGDHGGSQRLAEDDARGLVADRVLAAALARAPQHAGLLCTQAAWDRARGRVLPALRNYRLAQAAEPECVDAWLGAARLLRERENYTDAAAYAQQGLARRPDPALRQELALALVGQGRLDDAILQLEAYLEARPHDHDTGKVLANVLIGRAYARLGEPGASHAEVLRTVERALAYNPDEGKAHLVLGRIRREQRRLPEAIEHLETAFRQLPGFEDTRRLLAECLGDYGYERVLQRADEAAANAWLRCVAVAPADFELSSIRAQLQAIWRRLEARGVQHARAGESAAAIADFRLCLRIDPEQHWTAWLLATVLQKDPGCDLVELEALCRQAKAWQERHGLDCSEQTLLLATTLQRRGQAAAAREVAQALLRAPSPDAKPQVLAALRRLAGD